LLIHFDFIEKILLSRDPIKVYGHGILIWDERRTFNELKHRRPIEYFVEKLINFTFFPRYTPFGPIFQILEHFILL
jgi:hypothetical protein